MDCLTVRVEQVGGKFRDRDSVVECTLLIFKRANTKDPQEWKSSSTHKHTKAIYLPWTDKKHVNFRFLIGFV